MEIPKNFPNSVDIFSSYSPELVTRKSLELVTRNSLDTIMRNDSVGVRRNSSELGLIYFWEIITRKSQAPTKPLPLYGVHHRNFSMENLSLEILETISNFCRHFYRVFPWMIPGNFRGFSAKLLPGWEFGANKRFF